MNYHARFNISYSKTFVPVAQNGDVENIKQPALMLYSVFSN